MSKEEINIVWFKRDLRLQDHEPPKLTLIEQELYGCVIGRDYPFPIVDVEKTRKAASDIMWGFRKGSEVKEEGKRILKKHVNSAHKKMAFKIRRK